MPAIPSANPLNPQRVFGTVDVLRMPALPGGGNRIGSVAYPFEPSKPLYFFYTGPAVHVAAASTLFFDMFNATSALIARVLTIRHITALETAVTGIGFEWLLERTTAVGTTGTALTAWSPDTSDLALDSSFTARLKAGGGATASTNLFHYYTHSEETDAAAGKGVGLEILPDIVRTTGKGIVLRPGGGIRINQETNSSEGNSALLVGFTVE